jgi:hypothetical protein
MHWLLDERMDLAADKLLQGHANECLSCSRMMQQWTTVALEIDSRAARRPQRVQRPKWAMWNSSLAGVGIAAVWLVAAFWHQPPNGAPVSDGLAAAPKVAGIANHQNVEIDLAEFQARLKEPQWWGEVVASAWRPVDPVAKGMRPLADSLQTALEMFAPRKGSAEQSNAPSNDDASAGRYDFYLALA